LSFDVSWLDLREPADRAARDPALLAAAVRHLAAHPAPLALDLGCGTGASCRAFAGSLPELRWRLVDRDPALLRLAVERCPGAEAVRLDLAELDALPLSDVRLVTASALLDLCGAAWLGVLARRLARAGIGIYAALSYDGRLAWDPPLPGDAGVVAAFNAHQRRDKGLGPALGPEAAAAFARTLAAEGYAVRLAESQWRLGPDDAGLSAALIDGIANAVAEAGLDAGAWAQARRAASGSGRAIVGHVDLLALPQGASAQSNTTSLSSP
jgi:SAM-dependent methyltransferase